MWIDRIQEILTDVCKYVLTAIIVTTMFTNLTNNSEVYVVGAIFVIVSFAACYYFDTLKEKIKKEGE